MSQGRRFFYAVFATIGLGFGAILYVQVYAERLRPVAENHPGPFSGTLELLNTIPVVVICGLVGAVWLWVLVGGAEEERARQGVR